MISKITNKLYDFILTILASIALILLFHSVNIAQATELEKYLESGYVKSFNKKIKEINSCMDVYSNGRIYAAILCSTGVNDIFWGDSSYLYQFKKSPRAVVGGGRDTPDVGFSKLDLGNGETEITKITTQSGRIINRHGYKEEGILKDNVLTLNCTNNKITLNKVTDKSKIEKIKQAKFIPFIPDIKYLLALKDGKYHYYDEYEYNFINGRFRYFSGEPMKMEEYGIISMMIGEGSKFLDIVPGGEIDLATLYPFKLEITDEVINDLFGYDIRKEGIPRQFYSDNDELKPYFENPCSVINKLD